jgi:hypothetical protein
VREYAALGFPFEDLPRDDLPRDDLPLYHSPRNPKTVPACRFLHSRGLGHHSAGFGTTRYWQHF